MDRSLHTPAASHSYIINRYLSTEAVTGNTLHKYPPDCFQIPQVKVLGRTHSVSRSLDFINWEHWTQLFAVCADYRPVDQMLINKLIISNCKSWKVFKSIEFSFHRKVLDFLSEGVEYGLFPAVDGNIS